MSALRQGNLTIDGVEWNPAVEPDEEVWVYQYYGASNHLTNEEYDVRKTTGHIDGDGDLGLASHMTMLPLYAHKWRRPERKNLQPEVKMGDKVKVLGVLDGAVDRYREALMGQVVDVASTVLGNQGEITVALPNGYRIDGRSYGAISAWELVSDESPESHGETPDVTPEPEPVNWGIIIARWQDALNEYACDNEWCEEYEQVVFRLFGWEPDREVNFDVNVRLTRERWLSDALNIEGVFGGYESDIEIVDQREEFMADVVIQVMGRRGQDINLDKVREELEEQNYEFDTYEVTNYNTAEN